MRDYFSREELLTLAGDVQGERYAPTEVDEAQAQVIELLEDWARTAWPRVAVAVGTGGITVGTDDLVLATGSFALADEAREIVVVGAGAAGADLVTTILAVTSSTAATLAANAGTTVAGAAVRWGDGDGTAQAPRSRTETFDGGARTVLLSRVPVLEVTAVELGGDAVDADAYDLYPDLGSLVFDPPLRHDPRSLEVTYDYGYLSTPATVKRAAMQAAISLLDSGPTKGSIPDDVEEYSTEGTRFVFGGREEDLPPWPWDRDATKAVRAYWNRHRPGKAGHA